MKYIEVVAAVIIKDGKIFATKRADKENFKGGWEFPGGKIEAGETKEAALVREIKEELNTEIKVIKEIGTVKHQYPFFHLTMHCFICDLISGNLDLSEHIDSTWLKEDELDSLDWLPADLTAIELLKKTLLTKE